MNEELQLCILATIQGAAAFELPQSAFDSGGYDEALSYSDGKPFDESELRAALEPLADKDKGLNFRSMTLSEAVALMIECAGANYPE